MFTIISRCCFSEKAEGDGLQAGGTLRPLCGSAPWGLGREPALGSALPWASVQLLTAKPQARGSQASFEFSQFSSVAQSCLTLCDPINCSTPGLSVHHQLLEFIQPHVH